MSRIYLLLRNNQQTGPYSLEEILELNLKPFDLVWEEGRSAAWRYPGEIDSLKPYVIATPLPATPFEPVATAIMETDPQSLVSKDEIPLTHEPVHVKNVFVSMPRKVSPVAPVFEESKEIPLHPDPIELKAEELSQKVQAFRNENQVSIGSQDIAGAYNYYRPVKRKPAISFKGVLALTAILTVILAGYFIFSGSSNNMEQQVSPQANVLPGPMPTGGMNSNIEKDASTHEVSLDNQDAVNIEQPARPDQKPQQAKTLTPSKTAGIKTNENIQVENIPAEEGITHQPVEEKITDEPLENPSAEPVKEKKKLREVVKGIFSKKKEEKSEPIINEPVSVPDRKAKKREEQEVTNQDADISLLAQNIDLFSNSPDNWMMGIKGLKVTLRNNNTVAIQTATVVISYFDGNNKLLEKKSIVFNNIPANGKLTLPAPDHQWAEHTELALGNLSIRKDVYARE